MVDQITVFVMDLFAFCVRSFVVGCILMMIIKTLQRRESGADKEGRK